jgi:elongation factor Ts
MDVRNALSEAEGDEQKAIAVLRKTGAASAAKRGSRSTSEGVIASYIHADGRKGALVEVQSETDFVARNEDFKEFARQVDSRHGNEPRRISLNIPEEDVANGGASSGRREGRRQTGQRGERSSGQLHKWASEIVLLDQKHFNEERYEGKTIEDLRTELAANTGENVRIARFARFEVGQE